MSSSPNQVASCLSRGESFLALGDHAQALAAFEQALDLAQHSCNPQAALVALQHLGRVHLGQGQPNRSVASIHQAIAIALEQHNHHALYECHRQLAQTYKSVHRFDLALHYLEAAEALRDSLGVEAGGAGAAAVSLNFPGFSARQGASGSDRLLIPDLPSAVDPAGDGVLFLFRSIVERVNVGVAVFQDGQWVYGNARLMHWIGYEHPAIDCLTLADVVTLPEDFDLTPSGLAVGTSGEGILRCQDGRAVEVEVYATTLEEGDRPTLVAYLRDLTADHQVASQLKHSEARYRSLIHHVPIGLCRFNPQGCALDANPALLNIFGFDSVAEFVVASPLQPGSPVVDQATPQTWSHYLGQPGLLKDCELKLAHTDGRDLWVRVVARAIADDSGAIQYYEGAVEDITEIKAAQTALEELAMRDSLTHAYNRRHFLDVASREIARSARFNHPISLLMLDIDHFKQINDTHGHLVGDEVLRNVALRLRSNLRQSDVLARYGGEEFILLMPETDQAQAWIGAERLRKLIGATPFPSESGALTVTISVGLSCWPASYDPKAVAPVPQINDLISRADQALYRAKQSGRNQTHAETWIRTVSSQIA